MKNAELFETDVVIGRIIRRLVVTLLERLPDSIERDLAIEHARKCQAHALHASPVGRMTRTDVPEAVGYARELESTGRERAETVP